MVKIATETISKPVWVCYIPENLILVPVDKISYLWLVVTQVRSLSDRKWFRANNEMAEFLNEQGTCLYRGNITDTIREKDGFWDWWQLVFNKMIQGPIAAVCS